MPKPYDQLLKQFLADDLDPADVPAFVNESAQQEELLATEFEKGLDIYKGESEALDKEILFRDVLERAKQLRPAPVRKMYKRWMVAASILIIIGVGSYFAFFNTKKDIVPVAKVERDVLPPVSNKARIVLSDGRTVSIDSLKTITDGSVTVTKDANGNIIYTGSADELKYNTLVNPRGSQVATTTLADGTKVWLNAGSSIKYFASNTGNERNVEISGEAYFEVAKDKQRPFIVKKGETSVTVLGTHFNVNGYDDDDELKITLLEGSVRVGVNSWQSAVGSGQSVTLKPGEQARIAYPESRIPNPVSRITVSNDVDIAEVMAWKNNQFRFMSADIRGIARQLERWYDVEVTINGDISNHFTGVISRNVNLNEVFNMLQETGTLNIKTVNRKITISK